MKVVTIVGARPQFLKASVLSRALRQRHKEVLVHTGQHYDYGLSGVFFDGLDLPAPDVNLGVGSASHGAQTGAMLRGLEEVLSSESPDWVLIFGDTNSTLAGALAASKLHLPVAHVEAGLRSFNRRMPEEINRVVADHLSDLLLCPTSTAVANLANEGIARHVHLVGDVMLDLLHWAKSRMLAHPSEVLGRLGLRERKYLLATVHRSENTDDPSCLAEILRTFNAIKEEIIFPVHPRSRNAIAALQIPLEPHVRLIEPVGYLDMVALTQSARLVLTDSGGLQKEACWLGVPCVTLREETEWIETVASGWNVLTGADREKIMDAVATLAPPPVNPHAQAGRCVAAACVELMEAGLLSEECAREIPRGGAVAASR